MIFFPFSVYTEFAFTLIDNAIVVNLFYGLLDAKCAYHQELWQHNRIILPTWTCDCIGKIKGIYDRRTLIDVKAVGYKDYYYMI